MSDAEPGVRVDVVASRAGPGRSSIRSGPFIPFDPDNLSASTITALVGRRLNAQCEACHNTILVRKVFVWDFPNLPANT